LVGLARSKCTLARGTTLLDRGQQSEERKGKDEGGVEGKERRKRGRVRAKGEEGGKGCTGGVRKDRKGGKKG